jgi:hypothetical protein
MVDIVFITLMIILYLGSLGLVAVCRELQE